MNLIDTLWQNARSFAKDWPRGVITIPARHLQTPDNASGGEGHAAEVTSDCWTTGRIDGRESMAMAQPGSPAPAPHNEGRGNNVKNLLHSVGDRP